MLFIWPKLLYPYYSLLFFFLSLLSVYRLVLWGWGLRHDESAVRLASEAHDVTQCSQFSHAQFP